MVTANSSGIIQKVMIAILSILFIILYSILWGVRDVNIISNDRGYNVFSKRWHILGWWLTALIMLPIFYVNPIPSFIIGSIIICWQLHDSVIGWMLYKKPFYLGSKGFDGWLLRVFQSGKTVTVIRMGILLCCILNYIRL
jgi:hypothetical protein